MPAEVYYRAAAGWTGHRIAPDFGEILAARRHDMFDTFRTNHGRWRRNPYAQRQLAQRVGVCASTISAWERGHRMSLMRPVHFWRLAKELRLQPQEMLEAAGYLPSEASSSLLKRS